MYRMKKHLLIIFLSIFSFNCYAQTDFERGYFINNNDEKISCLIKNGDWKNTPSKFKYKLSEGSEVKIETIKSAKEFGILNESKYKRFIVGIDRSSDNLNKLSDTKDPILKEEQLFLKTIIEGKASLFYYEDRGLKRYFFSVDDSRVEQLIYKSYKTTAHEIKKNNKYKQQLWFNLKCQTFSMDDINRVGYRKSGLIKLFIQYNECKNSISKKYQKKRSKKIFNLSITPGLDISSLSTQNNKSDFKDTDFGQNLGFRLGIEAELILPFNNNKWAVFVEPTYQYFKSEKEITYILKDVITKKTNVKVDYKSIELPIGIRHSFYFNDNSKLFINAAYILDINLGSSLHAESRSFMDYEINSKPNFVFGVGYKYKNKYSFEIRSGLKRNILGTDPAASSDYKKVSLIFGYSIF